IPEDYVVAALKGAQVHPGADDAAQAVQIGGDARYPRVVAGIDQRRAAVETQITPGTRRAHRADRLDELRGVGARRAVERAGPGELAGRKTLNQRIIRDRRRGTEEIGHRAVGRADAALIAIVPDDRIAQLDVIGLEDAAAAGAGVAA